MKLALFPPVDEERLKRIVSTVDGDVAVGRSEDEAVDAIVTSDAFFGKITPQMLKAARRLRWIQSPTASLEHYLFPELIRHPAVLTNMRGIFSDVIADHVMGYVLCFARNLHIYVRRQVEASWSPCGGEEHRPEFHAGAATVTAMDRATLHVADLTMGIVGLGAIGREVCRRAAVFGMSLLAVDAEVEDSQRKDVRELPPRLKEIWPTARLDEMLALSDVVCVCVPHTPRTFKLFRRARFQRMRRTAYFINIGRGAVVDLADLTAALRAGEIAGAALDVFEVEPLPSDHDLWRLDNVIMTPHVAGFSPRVAERHLEVLLENIHRFREGYPLLNVVDKEKWY
ncbi:MAG: D-2-hydroxyacid dehydrogenase [Planctomycetota bacterium]|nr:D-2-hydroxyacid dehydrogenase [Planctomycetota bacterium]